MRWLNSVNGNVSGRYRKPNLPIRGKQRAHDEKAAYPSWASSVPDFNQNRSLELSVHYIDSANELRTDNFYGKYENKHPMIVVGLETERKMKDFGLKGIDFDNVYG